MASLAHRLRRSHCLRIRLFRAGEGLSEEEFNTLLNSKLMVVATAYKWETHGRRRVLRSLLEYLLHLVLAAVTLMMSTQLPQGPTGDRPDRSWSTTDAAMWCNVLQMALLVTNSYMLYREIRDVKLQAHETTMRAALTEYFRSWWNFCNLTGIAALYVASAAHFTDARFLLEQVGAVGVLLNTFSLLELLQPFESTGVLIKVIT